MSWLGPFLLLLGPLVVIHELGHFLVAKLFGVRCDRFSIGFGPRLLGYRFGETEYVICALPLGGYVKMLGESAEEECSPEEQDRSFLGQTPLRRTLIALAGPAANLILSVGVIAAVLMTIGWPALASRIGRVFPESPAAEAGLRYGDRIVEIDGKAVNRWTQVQEYVRAGGGSAVSLVVDRRGERISLEIVPKVDEESGQPRIGIAPARLDPVLVFPDSDVPGVQAGLRTGDRVVRLGDREIFDIADFDALLEQTEGPLEMVVERVADGAGRKRTQVEVAVDDGRAGTWTRERLGAVPVDFAIAGILIGSPARQAGLQEGDIFLEVNGKRVRAFSDVEEQLQQVEATPVAIKVWRDGREIETEAVPREAPGLPPGEPARWELGVLAMAPAQPGEQINERETNPFLALKRGTEQTVDLLVEMVAGVGKLVTREVGLDAVSGPIGIGQIAADAFKEPGWFTFLRIMALISVNLAIINLLPVPMLDGGHIVFAAAEAISGGPLGVRARELAQVAGISFIALLMGFAFWNDIARNWHWIASFFQNLAQ